MDEINNLTKVSVILSQAKKADELDRVNFTELYRKNSTQIYYYLYSRVGNVADAEDLTSQTFITALENFPSLRDPNKFTSWVFSIARNKAFDFFRKAQRRPTIDFDEELDQTKVTEGELSQADQDHLHDLERLISRLRPIEQEYLRLRIVAQLPFAEIAMILNEPETRIKKKYYRLLERLQAQVEH